MSGFEYRIDPVPPGVGQELALALEPLPVDLHGGGPSDPESVRSERREEPADHELVDRRVVGAQLLRVDGARRIDRRVVGRLGAAPGRPEARLLEHELGGFGERALAELLDQGPQSEPARVDGVVRPRVADETLGVEVLGDPHHSCGAESEARRLGHEERGGERDGRPAPGLLLRELPDDPALGVSDEAEDPVRVDLLLEDPVMVMQPELLAALLPGGDDLPERGGNELLDRLVPLDQERERGGLHPADGEEALAALLRREGEVASQEGAPDEVDLLA